MRHGRLKVPAWLLVIAITLAIAVHVVLLFQLGARVTVAAALGIAALVLIAKHFGFAAWSHRKTRAPESTGAAHEDES